MFTHPALPTSPARLAAIIAATLAALASLSTPTARAVPPTIDASAFSARFETRPIRIVGAGPTPSKLTLTVDRKLVDAARHAVATGSDPIFVTVTATFQPNPAWAVALASTAPNAGIELQPIPFPTGPGGQLRAHHQLRFRPDLACPARGTCRIRLTTQVQSDLPLHPSQGAPRDEHSGSPGSTPHPNGIDLKAFRAARTGPIVVTVVVAGPANAAPTDIALRTNGRNLAFVTRLPKPWPPAPATPVETPADPAAPVTPVTDDRGPRPARLDACSTDSDCTTTCFRPNDCCAGQCRTSCAYAVNRWFIAELKADHAARCRQQRCPPVGCALDTTIWGARCTDGRCVAVMAFGKGLQRF